LPIFFSFHRSACDHFTLCFRLHFSAAVSVSGNGHLPLTPISESRFPLSTERTSPQGRKEPLSRHRKDVSSTMPEQRGRHSRWSEQPLQHFDGAVTVNGPMCPALGPQTRKTDSDVNICTVAFLSAEADDFLVLSAATPVPAARPFVVWPVASGRRCGFPGLTTVSFHRRPLALKHRNQRQPRSRRRSFGCESRTNWKCCL
jgi:hypothetical protein